MQLSAQLEAHFQAYDAQIKQACAKLKVVWGSLELSVDEQAGELTRASQKALDVWSAACTEAERRICAVESSIEDMRREITKKKDLLKLSEARTVLEPRRTDWRKNYIVRCVCLPDCTPQHNALPAIGGAYGCSAYKSACKY